MGRSLKKGPFIDPKLLKKIETMISGNVYNYYMQFIELLIIHIKIMLIKLSQLLKKNYV